MARRISLAILGCCFIASFTMGADSKDPWQSVKIVDLEDWKVGLSEPALVARSKGFLWFPTIMRLSNGEVLAMLNNYSDEVVHQPTAFVCWSKDDGRTWTEPQRALYGDSNFRLTNGDHLILPYNLYPGPGKSLIAPHQIVAKGEHMLRVVKEGLVVTGLPRPDQPNVKRGVSGFVFNGSGVALKDGAYLATLYGTFEGQKRLSLLVAESVDGFRWQVRAVVADEKCQLTGRDGPSEAATCRLKDGRLMCIFRLGAGAPYGQSFSSNDGKTWTEPVAMKDVFSVQPCLVVRKDGTVILSGGRPGLFIWINSAGDGKDWQRIDMRAHHNACQPRDPISVVTTDGKSTTTAYTRIIPLDDDRLLYVYDRIPHGWHAIPKDSTDSNSVWGVRIALERKSR